MESRDILPVYYVQKVGEGLPSRSSERRLVELSRLSPEWAHRRQPKHREIPQRSRGLDTQAGGLLERSRGSQRGKDSPLRCLRAKGAERTSPGQVRPARSDGGTPPRVTRQNGRAALQERR
jgi:hypothetical protein